MKFSKLNIQRSRRVALEACAEAWRVIAKSDDPCSKDPAESILGGLKNYCPCCEYASSRGYLIIAPACERICPMVDQWPAANRASHLTLPCCRNGSPFQDWANAICGPQLPRTLERKARKAAFEIARRASLAARRLKAPKHQRSS